MLRQQPSDVGAFFFFFFFFPRIRQSLGLLRPDQEPSEIESSIRQRSCRHSVFATTFQSVNLVLHSFSGVFLNLGR